MSTHQTIAQIQIDIKSGSTSCLEIVETYLEAIKQQSHLNAFLEVYEDEARQQADKVDKKIGNGSAGKLAGCVMGIKDNICYKDHRVSASSKILEGFRSLYSSTVTEKLIAEDVIIIGRLNCDEFAMGSSNENSAFGNVLNPVQNNKVPGGSSGGAAAAVKAGLCHAALGTDTGGSIRQPASLCDVVGFKPTYGRVSRHGIIAYASSFDQVGPISTSVDDAALIMEVIAGSDEYDSTVSSKEVPLYSQQLEPAGKRKIAYLTDCLNAEGLDEEIKNHLLSKIDDLRNSGHQVDPVDFPFLDYLVPAYYVLTTAEASSNLARYDGIHYGYRSEQSTTLDSTYKKSRTEGFGEEVKRRIMLGTFVLSAGYYDAYYSKGQKVRRIIQDETAKILSEYEFILLPTTPRTAPEIGENMDDPIAMYLEDIFTVQANLTGLPAISIPLGHHSNGLPFGMQLIGNKFEEASLLSFSKEILQK
ncbi:MAG: Asp-tRNA(Asn)/Glu-tRNA(Gln) amidotransferase subunit GatA [Flavobacteriales bacterium]|nr:Asp-tRNA(Asn)/Glu-tRNA(Gln) amidotransferase subunit GatA [Flavobacteriales bacterium]